MKSMQTCYSSSRKEGHSLRRLCSSGASGGEGGKEGEGERKTSDGQTDDGGGCRVRCWSGGERERGRGREEATGDRDNGVETRECEEQSRRRFSGATNGSEEGRRGPTETGRDSRTHSLLLVKRKSAAARNHILGATRINWIIVTTLAVTHTHSSRAAAEQRGRQVHASN